MSSSEQPGMGRAQPVASNVKPDATSNVPDSPKLEPSVSPLLHFPLLDKGASERSLLLRALMQFACYSARNAIHANPSSVNFDDMDDFFTCLTKRACVGSPFLSKLVRERLATSHLRAVVESEVPSSQTLLSSAPRATTNISHTTPPWGWHS